MMRLRSLVAFTKLWKSTMPPESGDLPTLSRTRFRRTSVFSAPVRTMPDPWRNGRRGLAGQYLLFLTTVLFRTASAPARGRDSSPTTKTPAQFLVMVLWATTRFLTRRTVMPIRFLAR